MPNSKIKALISGQEEPSKQDLAKTNAYINELRQLPDEELDVLHSTYQSNMWIRAEKARRTKQRKEQKLYGR